MQRTFNIVQRDFALADKENFAIGLKPVRGAYIDEVSLIEIVLLSHGNKEMPMLKSILVNKNFQSQLPIGWQQATR